MFAVYAETSTLPLDSLSDLFDFVCALCSLSASPRAVRTQALNFLSRLLESNVRAYSCIKSFDLVARAKHNPPLPFPERMDVSFNQDYVFNLRLSSNTSFIVIWYFFASYARNIRSNKQRSSQIGYYMLKQHRDTEILGGMLREWITSL